MPQIRISASTQAAIVTYSVARLENYDYQVVEECESVEAAEQRLTALRESDSHGNYEIVYRNPEGALCWYSGEPVE